MIKRKVAPRLSSSGANRSASTTSPPKASADRVRSKSVATRRPTPVADQGAPKGAKAAAKTDDDAADDLYRVRSFTTKTGVVVNRGDSFKRRGPKPDKENAAPICPPQTGVFRSPPPYSSFSSNRPEAAATGDHSAQDSIPLGTGHIVRQFPVGNAEESGVRSDSSLTPSKEASAYTGVASPSGAGGRKGRHDSRGNTFEDEEENESPPVYKVVVLGSQGVGKTTLTKQLLSSEYYSSDCNNTDDRDEETVTVLLDEEESVIQFVDSTGIDIGKPGPGNATPSAPEGRFETRLGSRDMGKMTLTGDGFLVVYSVTDRSSFSFAQSCLQELRPAKRHNAVILVANKHDLVRKRLIPETDGIKLATKRHCKFIEVSALLDHRLDELLVGIVRQIRLRQTNGNLRPPDTASGDGKTTGNRLSDTIGTFFQKVFGKDRATEGKCEDLMVP